MKKIVFICVALGLAGAANIAQANAAAQTSAEQASVSVDKTDPYHMISEVADITFKRFAAQQAQIRENPNMLKEIVREELLPYVNYRYAALKVLGKHLRKQKKEDVEAFIPVFRDYLITQYAQVFTLYKQQRIVFEKPKTIKQQKTLAVGLEVIEPGRPPIEIAFQVRKNKQTQEWLAFNMIAEGVSLLDSKRAELSSLISQKGLNHVTKLLKEKSESNIVFKDAA